MTHPRIVLLAPEVANAQAVEDRRVTCPMLQAYFNVTDRTIDRWVANTDLGFPYPLKINGRRYWQMSAILAWEVAQAAKTGARAASAGRDVAIVA